MNKCLILVVLAATLCMLSDTVLADSIKGRLGVTGRLGLTIPSDSEVTTATAVTIIPSITVGVIGTDKGKAATTFVGGGGLVYGVTDNLAIEVDVAHTPAIEYEVLGQKTFEITTTNVSLGFQHRLIPESKFVPYLGAGVDFIVSDGSYLGRDALDIETVVGTHLNAGADLFISKRIALNADFRGVLAPAAEINNRNCSAPGTLDTR